ncbi:MAG: biotin/lipoyl-containing protein [Chloroflexota bacterium]
MKYVVTIADKSYEVEIEDIQARPVIAHVGGQRFEVHPENGNSSKAEKDTREFEFDTTPRPSADPNANTNELTAPLPGTIIEVFVKAGDQVESGQIIVVIEAMKMKNSIRSTRAGKVAEVLVSAGQTAAHKQALVRFE